MSYRKTSPLKTRKSRLNPYTVKYSQSPVFTTRSLVTNFTVIWIKNGVRNSFSMPAPYAKSFEESKRIAMADAKSDVENIFHGQLLEVKPMVERPAHETTVWAPTKKGAVDWAKEHLDAPENMEVTPLHLPSYVKKAVPLIQKREDVDFDTAKAMANDEIKSEADLQKLRSALRGVKGLGVRG